MNQSSVNNNGEHKQNKNTLNHFTQKVILIEQKTQFVLICNKLKIKNVSHPNYNYK
jgi:hypothetical protein